MDYFKMYLEDIGGYFGNTATSGYDGQFFGIGKSLNLPTPTLEIPARRIEGRIRSIYYTENPISIVLDGGAIMKVNKQQWNYLKSIGKEPKENKIAQIEMYLDGTIKSFNLN